MSRPSKQDAGFAALEQRIGYAFRDGNLLREAILPQLNPTEQETIKYVNLLKDQVGEYPPPAERLAAVYRLAEALDRRDVRSEDWHNVISSGRCEDPQDK